MRVLAMIVSDDVAEVVAAPPPSRSAVSVREQRVHPRSLALEALQRDPVFIESLNAHLYEFGVRAVAGIVLLFHRILPGRGFRSPPP
jgi:hypothetical protein